MLGKRGAYFVERFFEVHSFPKVHFKGFLKTKHQIFA